MLLPKPCSGGFNYRHIQVHYLSIYPSLSLVSLAVSGLGGRLTIMIIDSESKLEVGDVGALDRTTIIMVTLASLTSFLAFIASVAYIVLIMHNKIETFEKTRYRPLASDADDRNLQERLITK